VVRSAAPQRSPSLALTPLRRDLETCTLLASYKGNASPRGCLCRMGPSHFLAGASRAQPPLRAAPLPDRSAAAAQRKQVKAR
jgi:hypothetical protein